jgi:hypothetical protein
MEHPPKERSHGQKKDKSQKNPKKGDMKFRFYNSPLPAGNKSNLL